MCGICGFFHKNGQPARDGVIDSMLQTIAHRGPDGEGTFTSGCASFGHKRLAIVDITHTADQPMSREGYTITYNGEIYNYKSLRNELISLGHSFLTESDTEVVLLGYMQWGRDVLNRLDGFFAFAIWNESDKSVFLARDPFGVKPLFYHNSEDIFIFASELKPLIVSNLIDIGLNMDSVSEFLSCAYIAGERSVIKGVNMLAAGSYMHIKSDKTETGTYHRITKDDNVAKMPEDEICAELRRLMSDAVRKSLTADVPVGLCLSGGLDSNILLYEMSKYSSEKIKTFTVDFDETSYSEGDVARLSADKYGADHNEISFEWNDFDKKIKNIASRMDCLNANPGALVGDAFYRFTADSVKTSLLGTGGDELFGGYVTYKADKILSYYKYMPKGIRRFIKKRADAMGQDPRKYSTSYMASKFCEGAEFSREKAHYWWRTIFSDEEKQMVMGDALPSFDAFSEYEKIFDQCRDEGFDFYTATGISDLRIFMGCNANILADNLGMSYGLEMRPSMLDKSLADFAYSIPYDKKFGVSQTKKILRKAYADILPDDVINMKKHGAVAPLGYIFKGKYFDYVYDTIIEGNTGVIDKAFAEKLLIEQKNGEKNNEFKIYSLLIFTEWYKSIFTIRGC